jgi:hypothetical protein
MHKIITKINKAAIIIIYHHGTKGKNKVVILFMMKLKTNTHAEKLNKN